MFKLYNLRIDQPFRLDVFPRMDTAHKMIENLKKGTFTPFADHWFSPTLIEDFAKIIDWAVQTTPQGIFHATCDQKVSDFEYATLIQQALNIPGTIEKGSLEEYLKTTQRPYQRNTAMTSKKLFSILPFTCLPLEEAVAKIEM